MKRQIITSYKDEIYVYHIRLEGTNEEIGFQLGQLAKQYHNIDKSSKIDHKIIEDQYNYLKTQYPEYYSRICGFANAYGKTLKDTGYDFSYFGKIPDGISCSAVYYPPSLTETGHGHISRNLDFVIPRNLSQKEYPFKETYVIEMHPNVGYSSLSLFCFDVFGTALEGVNSKGLAVVHLADADTRLDHSELSTHQTRRGFNEFLPVQYILDKCSTTQKAKKELKRLIHYHVAIPTHLLIADKNGDACVFEYTPDGVGKTFVGVPLDMPFRITNFQLNRLNEDSYLREMEPRSAINGLDRYRTLEETLEQVKYPVTSRQIREVNTSVYIHEDRTTELNRTIFHNIYDITNQSAKYCLLPTETSQPKFYSLNLR